MTQTDTQLDQLQALLDAVERIRPILEEHAPQAESDRSLPGPSYQAMADAGLFKMCKPKHFGGYEMHPCESMAVWEAVARIDPAAAWNLVMNQAVANYAGWLPDEGARELMESPNATVAGALFPPGSARPVDGGYLISACVPFASGCHNATGSRCRPPSWTATK